MQNQKNIQNNSSNVTDNSVIDRYSDNPKDSYNYLLQHSDKIYESINNERQNMKNNVNTSSKINLKRIVIGFMILLTFVYGPSLENNEYVKNILFSNNEFFNNIVKVICLGLIVYVIGFNYMDTVDDNNRFSKMDLLSVIIVLFLLYCFLTFIKNVRIDIVINNLGSSTKKKLKKYVCENINDNWTDAKNTVIKENFDFSSTVWKLFGKSSNKTSTPTDTTTPATTTLVTTTPVTTTPVKK